MKRAFVAEANARRRAREAKERGATASASTASSMFSADLSADNDEVIAAQLGQQVSPGLAKIPEKKGKRPRSLVEERQQSSGGGGGTMGLASSSTHDSCGSSNGSPAPSGPSRTALAPAGHDQATWESFMGRKQSTPRQPPSEDTGLHAYMQQGGHALEDPDHDPSFFSWLGGGGSGHHPSGGGSGHHPSTDSIVSGLRPMFEAVLEGQEALRSELQRQREVSSLIEAKLTRHIKQANVTATDVTTIRNVLAKGGGTPALNGHAYATHQYTPASRAATRGSLDA